MKELKNCGENCLHNSSIIENVNVISGDCVELILQKDGEELPSNAYFAKGVETFDVEVSFRAFSKGGTRDFEIVCTLKAK